jgi:signal transduction histidine kinase
VVEASIAALYDHRNQPIGRSLTLVDRTELKRLERELATRERLAALGELAAGIAHEIRNPLNGIELMLGLVQEDLNAQGFRDERFTRIHEEVSRLNSVLNDFLLFARPKPLEQEPADLTELAEDALMLLAPAIEDRHVAVERHYDRAAPPLMIDAAAMRRALVNLIKNACEAMPPHGTLHLSISGPQATGDSFEIEVRDTGPGIPDDVRERLFHPFFTTKSEGTGLGLAIVHKTIVSHNGSIACHNHPDGGACFVIRLPHAEGT